MSHLPLLRKDAHYAPRLQSPRRGPQVCACLLLACVIALVLPWALSLAESLAGGPLVPLVPLVPRRANSTAFAPPPEAVQRVLAALRTPGVMDGAARAEVEAALLASVGWLLERSLAAR